MLGPGAGIMLNEAARPAAEDEKQLPAIDETDAVPKTVTVSPDRRIHILSGDKTSGGHRRGTGIPGKTEFPTGWSDDKIVDAIDDVANDPKAKREQRADGRTVIEGTRDGVDIRVIVANDARPIVTAHPTNLPRNPIIKTR